MCKTIRIATHDLRTTRCHAAVPVHKVPQHMQTSKAQRQQRKKSHLEALLPITAPFEIDSTLKWRCRDPSRTRANFSLQRNLGLPEKTQCFMQILTFKSHP